MFELGTTTEETEQKIMDILVETVTRLQGCKTMELVCHEEICRLPSERIPDLVEKLIEEGRLAEVEYVLPALSFRIKGFLLPGGTEVQRIRGAK